VVGPRRPDAAPDEPGGRFLYLNTSRASVVVGRTGRQPRRAGVGCDVVVTDRPGTSHWVERRRIVVAITPFGLTGPYAGYRAHHLVAFHAGGEVDPAGAGWKRFPERAPVQIGATSRSTTQGGTPRCRARRLLQPAPDR
jgi:hypothetical protein